MPGFFLFLLPPTSLSRPYNSFFLAIVVVLSIFTVCVLLCHQNLPKALIDFSNLHFFPLTCFSPSEQQKKKKESSPLSASFFLRRKLFCSFLHCNLGKKRVKFRWCEMKRRKGVKVLFFFYIFSRLKLGDYFLNAIDFFLKTPSLLSSSSGQQQQNTLHAKNIFQPFF